MELQYLYHPKTYQECIDRINQLTPETKPKWGKMDVGQMLAHCSEIQEVFNGKELKKSPALFKLFKGFIKKAIVNKKPYKHSSPTHPQYKQTSPKKFSEQKSRLLKALEQFKSDYDQGKEVKHTLFGVMPDEERGWGAYKHLDHHLKQFGT